jgi:hypothetical protein
MLLFTNVVTLPFSEKYSTIADQVGAAASASIELQSHNQKASQLHFRCMVIQTNINMIRFDQVTEFVSEVDALHLELERLESSARVRLLLYSAASRDGQAMNCTVLRLVRLVSPILIFCCFEPEVSQELDTFSIQLETAFRQAAAKAK